MVIPGLNTFLDKFEGLFGKSYIVLGFLPALLLIGALAWVQETYGSGVPNVFLFEFFEDKGAEISWWVAAVVSTLIVGYILWALNAFFREILEGRYLPNRLRQLLEAQQQICRNDIEEELRKIRIELGAYRKHCGISLFDARDPNFQHDEKDEQWINQLFKSPKQDEPVITEDDVDTGGGLFEQISNFFKQFVSDSKLPQEEETDDLDADEAANDTSKYKQIESAKIIKEFSKMETIVAERKRFPFQKAKRLFDILMQNKTRKDLTATRNKFPTVARQAYCLLEAENSRVWSRRYFRFPGTSDIGATSMANMAAIHRTYAKERYGMEIEVLWPRLQPLVLEDAGFSPLVDSTKIKLDFSVVMVFVTFLFGLISVFLISMQATELPLFPLLLIPSTAFFLSWIFYKISVKSYRAFGEVLRSGIDLFRMDLAKRLSLEIPEDSEAEKKLWELVSGHTLLRSTEVIKYAPPEEVVIIEEAEE